LAFASGLGFAILFAILYGIAFGGRIPLMTSIRGEYFGRKAFATIMGWSMLPNGILMAIAPVWAGWMFDSYGSYTIPFVTYATLSIIGSVIMLFARKPNMIR
jgi:MFS family permease